MQPVICPPASSIILLPTISEACRHQGGVQRRRARTEIERIVVATVSAMLMQKLGALFGQ